MLAGLRTRATADLEYVTARLGVPLVETDSTLRTLAEHRARLTNHAR